MNVFQFFVTCKRTNNANNATHYAKLGMKWLESSQHNYYIISPRVIIKAIIIIKHVHKHTCKHVWKDTLQQLRQELMQTQEAPHVSFVQHNQPHLAPPMLGLHCTHFLRHQHPPTPHPLFPTYPRTVRRPWQAWVYCFTLINTPECTTLKKFCIASQWPLA